MKTSVRDIIIAIVIFDFITDILIDALYSNVMNLVLPNYAYYFNFLNTYNIANGLVGYNTGFFAPLVNTLRYFVVIPGFLLMVIFNMIEVIVFTLSFVLQAIFEPLYYMPPFLAGIVAGGFAMVFFISFIFSVKIMNSSL